MLVESHGLSCLYCKAQNKPESKHKKSREMPVSVVVQRFCMLIKLYKTYNPFLVVRRLCLNFSIQHWKRAVASYEIPNQICLFWQRNAVHSLFVANMCECRRTGHKHSAKRALCKLQGKKFQLSRKRIGPIENKMTLDRMSLMIKLNGVEKIWPFSGRTLIVRKHWRHEVGVDRVHLWNFDQKPAVLLSWLWSRLRVFHDFLDENKLGNLRSLNVLLGAGSYECPGAEGYADCC